MCGGSTLLEYQFKAQSSNFSVLAADMVVSMIPERLQKGIFKVTKPEPQSE